MDAKDLITVEGKKILLGKKKREINIDDIVEMDYFMGPPSFWVAAWLQDPNRGTIWFRLSNGTKISQEKILMVRNVFERLKQYVDDAKVKN